MSITASSPVSAKKTTDVRQSGGNGAPSWAKRNQTAVFCRGHGCNTELSAREKPLGVCDDCA